MIKFIKKLKISTLFVIYLVSNLLMLVIPGVTILLYNKELQRTVDQTAASVNKQMTRQFQLVMDSALGEIDGLYRTLYTDAQVESYLYKSGLLTDKDYYDGFELINRLSAIAQTKSVISDFFLYFPSSDAIITPGYRLKSSLHYNRLFSIPGMDYNTWIENLLFDGRNFRALPKRDETSAISSKNILLTRRLYLTSSDSLNPALCCVINPRDFESRLDFLGEDGDFAVIVRDYTGEKIFALGLIPEASRGVEINANYLGAKYELYLNTQSAVSGENKASGFNLIFTVLAFSISVLLAFLLAYRNYSPIRLIARQLEPKAQAQGVSTELKHLASSVDQAIKNNWALESELQKMEPIYINHILSDLLRGASTSASSGELLKKAGIHLTESPLMVVQVLVWDSGKYDYQGEDQGLIQAMIANVAFNRFKGKGAVHPVYGGESSFFLIIALSSEGAVSSAEPLLQEVCKTFSEDIGVSLCLSCSLPVGSEDELSSACSQAQSAAELVDFAEPGSVILYQKDRKNRLRDMYFPIDEELKILNAVRSGNATQVAQLIRTIIDENLFERVLDVVSIRFLLLSLGGTLLQCAQQLHYDLSTSVDDFPHLMDDLHSPQEIKDYFVERFVMLAKYADDRKNGRHKFLTDKIIALVEENYADSELSVSSLAEKIELTPYYLSSILKEHTGFNISYYIHHVRIKHAKQLLEDPSLTLNTIAQMTGYLSDVSFIRTFKRYEGITPGAYRDSLRAFPSN